MAKKYQLTFIGAGSAFTLGDNNFQSNLLLEDEKGKRLLIDCGTDARWALHELGLSHRHIDAVYVSHLHSDHIGGLEWLALKTKFDSLCTKPKLFISSTMAKGLWNNALSAGLSTLQGQYARLSSYFDVRVIDNHNRALEDNFRWSNLEFSLIQSIHVVHGMKIMPCFGLITHINDTCIYFTSDTQYTPDYLHQYYQMADIIFHDCETTILRSGVHAHYRDLCQLAPEIRQKMWLYHYNSGDLPNAKADGFLGFVKKGQRFTFE